MLPTAQMKFQKPCQDNWQQHICSFFYRCFNCVDVLFTRPSAACPECGTALRRSDFRVQQFEDLIVEKEVDIRKKIIKMYIVKQDL